MILHPWHMAAAYALDLLLGDPPAWPHPVRWIGTWISRMEAVFYGGGRQRLRGIGFVAAVLGGVLAAGAGALVVAFWVHPVLGHVVSIWLCYSTLATRSLHMESRRVVDALKAHDLPLARRRLSWIVSRDTGALDERGILRAVVETVSENLSDGIVAPLFYMALGGPLGALLYKTVNTMDSMVGYTNERYRHFGECAARLDDVVNWIPARLTGALLVGAAFICNGAGRSAWAMMHRDAHKMKSPNAGFPEAAAAGALGVQLGGASIYFGKTVEKPTLGDAVLPLSVDAYRSMIRLMYVTSLETFLLALGMRLLLITG